MRKARFTKGRKFYTALSIFSERMIGSNGTFVLSLDSPPCRKSSERYIVVSQKLLFQGIPQKMKKESPNYWLLDEYKVEKAMKELIWKEVRKLINKISCNREFLPLL